MGLVSPCPVPTRVIFGCILPVPGTSHSHCFHSPADRARPASSQADADQCSRQEIARVFVSVQKSHPLSLVSPSPGVPLTWCPLRVAIRPTPLLGCCLWAQPCHVLPLKKRWFTCLLLSGESVSSASSSYSTTTHQLVPPVCQMLGGLLGQ